MTVAPFASSDVDRLQPARRAPAVVRVGLLGLGQIGAAVARLAAARSPARHVDVEVTAALVRDPLRARSAPGVKATADAEAVFATRPTVIVEALGGLEPARTLVLEALARGIPVVTANKSLLAHHGERVGRSGRARRRLAPVRGERRGRRAVSRRLCPPPLRFRAHVHHRHRQRHDELHPVADAGRNERLRLGARRGTTPRLRRAGPVEGRGRDRCRREAPHPDSASSAGQPSRPGESRRPESPPSRRSISRSRASSAER